MIPRNALHPLLRLAGLCGLCGLGEVFLFHRMLWSGLRQTAGDYVNHLLTQFVLEHSYLWLLRRPDHAALWSPPIFHPVPDTLVFAENLLGVAPLYWLPRLLGLSPETAYQVWLLLLPALGFAAAYLLFRHGFRFAGLPAAAGAFLCVYGLSLGAQANNPQLQTLFPTYLGLYALCRLFQEPGRRPAWVAAAGACFVAQLYACFYLGWLVLFFLGVAALAMLAMSGLRPRLLRVLWENLVPLLATALAAGLLLAPLVLRSLAVVRQLGWSNETGNPPMLPQLLSWLYPGRRSLAYFWLTRGGIFAGLYGEPEQRLAFGFVTLACAALGYLYNRKSPWMRLALVLAAAVVLLLTQLPGGFSLWHLVRAVVPGARALRIVARAGVLLLIPAGIGLAAFLAAVAARPRSWGLAALLALCLAEQPYSEYTFDKGVQRAAVGRFAAAVPPGCRSFFLAVRAPAGGGAPHWVYQAEIMLAQERLGIPTVNGGYTRFQPPGYGTLSRNVVHGPADAGRLFHDLAVWQALQQLPAGEVCRIEADPIH